MKLSHDLKQKLKADIGEFLHARRERVTIESACPLTQSEKSHIVSSFPELEGKDIEYTIKPELLAGFVIMIGSKVADFSLKSKMKAMFDTIPV